jgi:uncharacterized membrane protein
VNWPVILIGSACSYALKLAGYLVPASWLKNRRALAITELMPAALLGALVATETATTDGHLVLDARIGAVGVAALLLCLRAPFLVVVVAGAATAASLRVLGWG